MKKLWGLRVGLTLFLPRIYTNSREVFKLIRVNSRKLVAKGFGRPSDRFSAGLDGRPLPSCTVYGSTCKGAVIRLSCLFSRSNRQLAVAGSLFRGNGSHPCLQWGQINIQWNVAQGLLLNRKPGKNIRINRFPLNFML